jgi:hypothetical protein
MLPNGAVGREQESDTSLWANLRERHIHGEPAIIPASSQPSRKCAGSKLLAAEGYDTSAHRRYGPEML